MPKYIFPHYGQVNENRIFAKTVSKQSQTKSLPFCTVSRVAINTCI